MVWFRLFLLTLSLLCSATGAANTITSVPFPPPSTPTTWQVFVDKGGRQTFEALANQPGIFSPLNGDSFTSDAGQVIWLKYQRPSHQSSQWLWIFSPRADYIDVYITDVDRQLIKHFETGELRPDKQRLLPSRAYLFPIRTEAPHVIYVRIESHQRITSWVNVFDAEQLITQERPAYFYGALFGALLTLIVLNFVRYIANPKPGYLWLTAIASCLLLGTLGSTGWLSSFSAHSPKLLSHFADMMNLTAALCYLGLLFSFARAFITRWQFRLLLANAVLIGLTLLSLLISKNAWQQYLLQSVCLTLPISVMLISGIFLHAGYKPARMFLFSSIAMLLGCFGAMPWLMSWEHLGHGWVMVLFLSGTTVSCLLAGIGFSDHLRAQENLRAKQRSSQALQHATASSKVSALSGISDELRQPMDNLLGMTELLLNTTISNKQKEYLHAIQNSGHRLMDIFDEVLLSDAPPSFEKHHNPQVAPIDLHQLFQEVVHACQNLTAQSVQLHSYIHDSAPRFIEADPALTRQLINVALRNALQCTWRGEVSIFLSGGVDRQNYRVVIADTSFIEPTAQQTRLLSSLVNHLKGQEHVDATSANQRRLTLEIPAQSSRDLIAAQPSPALQEKKILIVESNPIHLKILEQQCLSWGLDVLSANNGVEALALLNSHKHLGDAFDLLLVAQDLADMRGELLLQKLPTTPRGIFLVLNQKNAPLLSLPDHCHMLYRPLPSHTLRTALVQALESSNA